MIIVGVRAAGMPDWRGHAPGPLSPQQISDVVAWLASQRPQFPGQPYSSQGAVAAVSDQACPNLGFSKPANLDSRCPVRTFDAGRMCHQKGRIRVFHEDLQAPRSFRACCRQFGRHNARNGTWFSNGQHVN